MSSVPIYVLLSNDGDEDKILTANVDLKARLTHIAARNAHTLRMQHAAVGKNTPVTRANVNAHISDVIASHNLYVHRSFRPYVAMFHSYQVTPPAGGNVTLSGGGNQNFDLEYAGEFYNKCCLHAVFSGGTAVGHKWSWAPFVGHKWTKKVTWKVNTQELDTYDSHIAQCNYEYEVSDEKKDAYRRCVGQEVPKQVRVIQDNPVANGGALGPVDLQEYVWVTDGPQTPKVTQPELELHIPIHFWWNSASEDSFCSLLVPNGQRTLSFDFEKIDNLVQFYDLVPTTLTTGNAVTYNSAFWAANSVPRITSINIITQNIYVNPEICDVYIDKIGFSQVRLHRYEDFIVNSNTFNQRLSMAKWPVEEIRIVACPQRTPPANPSILVAEMGNTIVEDWATYAFVLPRIVPLAGRWNSPATTANATRAVYKEIKPVIDKLTFTIQGTKLYDSYNIKFFEDFLPAVFSEVNGRAAPKSPGHIMINFNAKPGLGSVSGHFNASRAKDIYLGGTCSSVGSSTSAYDTAVIIHIEEKTINFTYVTNGNIIIRYVG